MKSQPPRESTSVKIWQTVRQSNFDDMLKLIFMTHFQVMKNASCVYLVMVLI